MPDSAPVKMEGFADGITMAQKIEKWLEWSKTQEKPIPITKDVAKNLSVAGQKLNQSEDTVVELFSKGREESAIAQSERNETNNNDPDKEKPKGKKNTLNVLEESASNQAVKPKNKLAPDSGKVGLKDIDEFIAEQNPGNPTSVTRSATSVTRSTEKANDSSEDIIMSSIMADKAGAAKEAQSVVGDISGSVGAGIALQKDIILKAMQTQLDGLETIQKTDRIKNMANAWDGTGQFLGALQVGGGLIESLKGAFDSGLAVWRYNKGDSTARDKFLAKEMGYGGAQDVLTGGVSVAQGVTSMVEIANTTAQIGKDAALVEAGNLSYETFQQGIVEASGLSASSVLGVILGGIKTAQGLVNFGFDGNRVRKMASFKPISHKGMIWYDLIVNKIFKRLGADTLKTATGACALMAGVAALTGVGAPVALGFGLTAAGISLANTFYKFHLKRQNKKAKKKAEKTVALSESNSDQDQPEEIAKAKELIAQLKTEAPNAKVDEQALGLKDEAGEASVMVASAVREGNNTSKTSLTFKEMKEMGQSPKDIEDKRKLNEYRDGKETIVALGVSEAAAVEHADTIKSRISVTSRM
jgi:hypothetical protein